MPGHQRLQAVQDLIERRRKRRVKSESQLPPDQRVSGRALPNEVFQGDPAQGQALLQQVARTMTMVSQGNAPASPEGPPGGPGGDPAPASPEAVAQAQNAIEKLRGQTFLAAEGQRAQRIIAFESASAEERGVMLANAAGAALRGNSVLRSEARRAAAEEARIQEVANFSVQEERERIEAQGGRRTQVMEAVNLRGPHEAVTPLFANNPPNDQHLIAQTVRGLAEAGLAVGDGLNAIGAKVGIEDLAPGFLQGREQVEAFYGDAVGTPGIVARGIGRMVGELALFMTPGTVTRVAAWGVNAARISSSVRSVKAARLDAFLRIIAQPRTQLGRQIENFVTGAPIDFLIGAGSPENSIAGTLAQWTESPFLQKIADDPFARGFFEVAIGEAMSAPIISALTGNALGFRMANRIPDDLRSIDELAREAVTLDEARRYFARLDGLADELDVEELIELQTFARRRREASLQHWAKTATLEYTSPRAAIDAAETIVSDVPAKYVHTTGALDQPSIVEEQLELLVAQRQGPAAGVGTSGLPPAGARLEATEAKRGRQAWVDIRGTVVEEGADLAKALQPYRDPRVERFHSALLDPNGRITSHVMETSGAVNYVAVLTPDWFRQTLRRMQRTGSDRMMVAHNHPSGQARMSVADVGFTARLDAAFLGIRRSDPTMVSRAIGSTLEEAEALVGEFSDILGPRLMGQVVINDTTAEFVTGAVAARALNEGRRTPEAMFEITTTLQLPREAGSADWTDLTVDMGSTAASIGDVMRRLDATEGKIQVVFVDSQNQAIAVEQHTIDSLKRLKTWLTPNMRAHGAAGVFIAGDAATPTGLSDLIRGMEGSAVPSPGAVRPSQRQGLPDNVIDVFGADGQSARRLGLAEGGRMGVVDDPFREARRVSEQPLGMKDYLLVDSGQPPLKPFIARGIPGKGRVDLMDTRLQGLDELMNAFPDGIQTADDWIEFAWTAFGSQQVPPPPTRMLEYATDPEAGGRVLRQLTRTQRTEADAGLRTAGQLGRLLSQGFDAGGLPRKQAERAFLRLMAWNLLTRRSSAFIHESAFLDLVNSPVFNQFFDTAVAREWNAGTTKEWLREVRAMFPAGGPSPGNSAKNNANAIGEFALPRLSAEAPEGGTFLDRLAGLALGDTPTIDVRREYWRLVASMGKIGMDNNVFSLMLMMLGRRDLLLFDTVQTAFSWDAVKNFPDPRRPGDARNIYDPKKITPEIAADMTAKRRAAAIRRGADPNTIEPVAVDPGGGLNEMFSGPAGLAIYEILERSVGRNIAEIYSAAGRRAQDASLARLHWETWLLGGDQAASHETLRGVLRELEGEPEAFVDLAAVEGRFDVRKATARYTYRNGKPKVLYPTTDGTWHEFTPEAFNGFIKETEKAKYISSEARSGLRQLGETILQRAARERRPWIELDGVNRELLDEQVRQRATRAIGPTTTGGRPRRVAPARAGEPPAGGRRPGLAVREEGAEFEAGIPVRSTVPPELARRLEAEHEGLTLEIRDKTPRDPGAGTVWEIEAISLPKNLRSKGTGTAVMEKIVAEADRAGATLTLVPSTDFGATSVPRLRRFYAQFSFIRNRGARSDPRLPAGMFRRPKGLGRRGAVELELPAIVAGAGVGAAAEAATAEEGESRVVAALRGAAAGALAGFGAAAVSRVVRSRVRAGRAERQVVDVAQDAAVLRVVDEARVALRTVDPPEGPVKDLPVRAEEAVQTAAQTAAAEIDPNDFVNISKFALNPNAEGRLADEVARVVDEEGLNPKEVITNAETRSAAKAMGLDLEDILAAEDLPRLSGAQMLAMRNIITTNIQAMEALAERMGEDGLGVAGKVLSDTERQHLALTVEALEHQNNVLLSKFTVARSQTGRDLQNLKILANNTLDPVVWMARARKMLRRPNGQELPLTSNLQQSILDLIAAKDRKGLVQLLGSLRIATIPEQLVALWKAGLLSAPPTHFANILGNTVMAALETTKELPAFLFDRVVRVLTGLDTKGLPSPLAPLRGFDTGMAEFREVMGGIPMDEALTKVDLPREVTIDLPRVPARANAFLDVFQKSVFRFLTGTDRIFFNMAFRRSIEGQAQLLAKQNGRTFAELVAEPTDEMLMRARFDAQVSTFTNRNQIGSAAQGLKRGLVERAREGNTLVARWRAALGYFAAEGILPFTNTPTNVAARIFETSPFGLAIGALDVGEAVTLARAAKARRAVPAQNAAGARRAGRDADELLKQAAQLQRQGVDILGRAAVGTGAMFFMGYWLSSSGLMSGTWPRNQKEQASWQLQGKRENALLLDGKWRSLERISPAGNVLIMGAQFQQLTSDSEVTPADAAAGTLFGAKATLQEQTFLRGLKDFLDADERTGGNYFSNIIGSTVPNIVRRLAYTIDPVVRESNGVADAILSRTPFASRLLPPKIDQLGDEVVREKGIIANVFDPFSSRTERALTDPVIGELARVGAGVTKLRRGNYRMTADGFVVTSRSAAAVGGDVRELTDQEWDTMQRLWGWGVRNALERIIGEPNYQEARENVEFTIDNAAAAAGRDIDELTLEVQRQALEDQVSYTRRSLLGLSFEEARDLLADDARGFRGSGNR